MPEPCRSNTHQPLDAVWHHALSPGLEPIADDEPTQLGRLANAMTPAAAVNHAPPTHLRLEAVGHHAAALAQSVAGAPQIVSADAVEYRVDTVAGEPMNLLHEVGFLVVDRDAAHLPDHGGPPRRARSIHLDAAQSRQLQHRRADTTG